MKNLVTNLTRLLVLSLLLCTPQPASAFYDSSVQRWLSRDPLGETGGINLYSFVGNNPMNAFDPFGLDCFSDCMSRELGNARAFALTAAAYAIGTLGNIPCGGTTSASYLARTAFYYSTRGASWAIPPLLRLRAGILIGQNATAAARAAPVVLAFMGGYAAGTAIYCEGECPQSSVAYGRPICL